MRPYLSLILTVLLVLLVLIGLSAAGNVEFDARDESEAQPLRSTYNAGPTGVRALYQWLEESGYAVARWRKRFSDLPRQAAQGTLVIVGPFPLFETVEEKEAEHLREWLAAGGKLLIISPDPEEQFGFANIVTQTPTPTEATPPPAEETTPLTPLINPASDQLIVQPTAITRGLHDLALSQRAQRLKFVTPKATDQTATKAPETDEKAEEKEERPHSLTAPVIHLGDQTGAVLADFNYGAGRVVFFSDPFAIANNGLGRGGNQQLALNLLDALKQPGQPIYFDEYHHGYRSEENALLRYFNGTPLWWVLGQLLLLGVLLVYSYGKRFARPLPLPHTDRHSPLEFVGSMANLQQTAQARDLAIENIYPRFKARLCRRLSLPVKATPTEIAIALRKRRTLAAYANELELALQDSEYVLAGAQIDDQRLVELVAIMRRLGAELAR